MLGKSGAVPAIAAAAIVVLSACAANVAQDKNTGADGKIKGAKEMTFENGESNAKGIVTYPGGDRVDWKSITTPDNKVGTLDFKLTWKTPRPGLQLGMDIYDPYGGEIATSAKTSKKRAKSRGRERDLQVVNAKGQYFVRVYAVGRGDAGAYQLNVQFAELQTGPQYDPKLIDVADPPHLPDVPTPEVPCDEFQFDPKNPACKKICPKEGAPKDWPGCAGQCPNPPDINNPKCLETMPCPTPPDRKIKACTASKFPPCPDVKQPDPNNPNCDNATLPPAVGRVIRSSVDNGQPKITWSVGKAAGIAQNWSGTVLRGDTDEPLPGGTIKIISIDKNFLVGTVTLTLDQVSANPRAKFSAPPRSR